MVPYPGAKWDLDHLTSMEGLREIGSAVDGSEVIQMKAKAASEFTYQLSTNHTMEIQPRGKI